MTQTIILIASFLILLALVPFAIKWIQKRSIQGASDVAAPPRVVSALAVGPHQRVVTVEVGPVGARTWLVLGVTAQSITCLHTISLETQPVSPLVNSPAVM